MPYAVIRVKFEKSSVRGLGRNLEGPAIVHTISGPAQTFGMEVITEGVQTRELAALLGKIGRDMAQGYHFSESLPPEDVEKFLEE